VAELEVVGLALHEIKSGKVGNLAQGRRATLQGKAELLFLGQSQGWGLMQMPVLIDDWEREGKNNQCALPRWI
jgi:hypothetical protein